MATFSSAILCLIVISCAAVPSLATVYTVGDSAGWALGVDYGTWASGKTFSVGDSLVFNYATSHTVAEVSPSDYSACTVGNAISSDNTGSTTISLQTAGGHYFICGVVGHCSGGMKLGINVTGAASTTPAAPGGSTPSTPTSPAPPTTTITPPAGTAENLPSSSGTISPFAAVFVSGVVAMIYSLVFS